MGRRWYCIKLGVHMHAQSKPCTGNVGVINDWGVQSMNKSDESVLLRSLQTLARCHSLNLMPKLHDITSPSLYFTFLCLSLCPRFHSTPFSSVSLCLLVFFPNFPLFWYRWRWDHQCCYSTGNNKSTLSVFLSMTNVCPQVRPHQLRTTYTGRLELFTPSLWSHDFTCVC